MKTLDLINLVFYQIKAERKRFMENFFITWPQLELLQIIDASPGIHISKIKDVAIANQVDSSRMIRRLVELDYLRSEVDVEDKRAVSVYLTSDAEDLLTAINESLWRLNDRIQKDLPLDSRIKLNDLLTTLSNGFKN